MDVWRPRFEVCVALVSDHPLSSEVFAAFFKESIRWPIIRGRNLWEGRFREHHRRESTERDQYAHDISTEYQRIRGNDEPRSLVSNGHSHSRQEL
jgi:hypothetical protein